MSCVCVCVLEGEGGGEMRVSYLINIFGTEMGEGIREFCWRRKGGVLREREYALCCEDGVVGARVMVMRFAEVEVAVAVDGGGFLERRGLSGLGRGCGQLEMGWLATTREGEGKREGAGVRDRAGVGAT